MKVQEEGLLSVFQKLSYSLGDLNDVVAINPLDFLVDLEPTTKPQFWIERPIGDKSGSRETLLSQHFGDREYVGSDFETLQGDKVALYVQSVVGGVSAGEDGCYGGYRPGSV